MVGILAGTGRDFIHEESIYKSRTGRHKVVSGPSESLLLVST